MSEFRISAHMVECMVRGCSSQNPEIPVFSLLREETQNVIIESKAEIELVNRRGEGIRLTQGEWKILISLCRLLHVKSQNEKVRNKDFYTGNAGTEQITFKTPEGVISLTSPWLSISLVELTKEYCGGKPIGGENMKIVSDLIHGLADDPNKKALIKYVRTETHDKKKRQFSIEEFQSLIKIAKATLEDYEDGKLIDGKTELLIRLHPLFIDQIGTKYVQLPENILSKIIQANGNSNIPMMSLNLITELFRARSNSKKMRKDENGNPIYEIGKEKLICKIAPNCVNWQNDRFKRPQLLEIGFQKAIDTAKEIGLIVSFGVRNGSVEDEIYEFVLNKRK
jgi:hypothetical protein